MTPMPRARTPLARRHTWCLLLACALAIALLAPLSLMMGARPLSLTTVRQALAAFDPLDSAHLMGVTCACRARYWRWRPERRWAPPGR
jgi:iron complex transport system permease protein